LSMPFHDGLATRRWPSALSDIAADGGQSAFCPADAGHPARILFREGRGDREWQFWEEFFDGYFGLARSHRVTPDWWRYVGHCPTG
jgi:hypothetical protein